MPMVSVPPRAYPRIAHPCRDMGNGVANVTVRHGRSLPCDPIVSNPAGPNGHVVAEFLPNATIGPIWRKRLFFSITPSHFRINTFCRVRPPAHAADSRPKLD